MKTGNANKEKRTRRHAKIRATLSGTAERPRLSVFKSNKHLYAQLIDDDKAVTLATFSSLQIKDKKGKLMEKAGQIGEGLAKVAQEKKITKVVFDRGGFVYRGKIAALAEGARKGGLQF